MGHDRLKQRLLDQLRELRNPEYAEELQNGMVASFVVPVETGLLKDAVTEKSNIRKTVEGFEFGVGNADKMGNPNRAPRNTIKEFLSDFPEFKRKTGVTSRYAWWALPPEAKKRLESARRQGLYGGGYQGHGSGKSAYGYQQEGSQPEWQQSAQAAGISPTHFIKNGLDLWREVVVPKVIGRLMGSLRSK